MAHERVDATTDRPETIRSSRQHQRPDCMGDLRRRRVPAQLQEQGGHQSTSIAVRASSRIVNGSTSEPVITPPLSPVRMKSRGTP
jgi:hypothetical protein